MTLEDNLFWDPNSIMLTLDFFGEGTVLGVVFSYVFGWFA
jgi:hypothetical protein